MNQSTNRTKRDRIAPADLGFARLHLLVLAPLLSALTACSSFGPGYEKPHTSSNNTSTTTTTTTPATAPAPSPSPTASPSPVAVPVPTQLAITAGSSSALVGACAGPFLIATTDGVNPVNAVSAVQVNLTGGGSGAFYADPTCGSAITSIWIPSGTNYNTFYFKDSSQENLVLTGTDSAAALTAASYPFAITSGAASSLSFQVQPSSNFVSTAISPSVVVRVLDSAGNVVTSPSGNITLSIQSNPGAGTLAGTLTQATVSGVATFSGLSINNAGMGYTLKASGFSVNATSAAFNIYGIATKLTLSGPANAVYGTCAGPFTVTARDASNNATIVSSTRTVNLAGNGAGTYYSDSGCTTSVTSVQIAAGTGTQQFYFKDPTVQSLTFSAADSAAALTTGTMPFNVISNTPASLVFSVQPSNSVAGFAISPSIQVTVKDVGGNTVTTASGNITLAIGTNPGAGTLSGTVTQAVASGVATFAGLSINKGGTGYTLTASGFSLNATSSAFNVAAPTKLTLAGPASSVWGICAGPFTVTTADASNNLVNVPSIKTVNLTGNGAGTYYSDAGCTSSVTSVQIAAGTSSRQFYFKDSTVESLILAAADASAVLTGATLPFTVSPGAPSQLVFTVQPTTTNYGATITPAVSVTVKDSGNNTVTSASGNITLAIGTNPGAGTLGGTLTQAVSGGVAAFSDLSINKGGTGYTLTASGFTFNATSSAFNINAPTKLVLTGPASAAWGTCAGPFTVTAKDASNVAINVLSSVTVNLSGAGSGSYYSDAGCSSSVTSVQIAAGTNSKQFYLKDLVVESLILSAADNAAALTSGTLPFTSAPGAPAQLVFSVQPVNTLYLTAITPAVTVTVQDSGGNTVTSASGNITMSIGTNPGSATLGGTTTQAVSSGSAVFPNLTLSAGGNGYTLSALGFALNVTSAAFNVNAPTKLVLAGPASAAIGACAGPFTVSSQDASNAAVNVASATVVNLSGGGGGTFYSDAACGTSASSVTLASGTSSKQFYFKDATVESLILIAADNAAVLSSSSLPYTVTAGPPAQLVFTAQPSSVQVSTSMSPAVVVTVKDASGNVVTGASGSITLAIGTNPGGSTLGGTLTQAVTSGAASFANLTLNNPGTGYTLTASGFSLNATSSTFNVLLALGGVTITTPATATFYSNSGSLSIQGACTTGSTVQLGGASTSSTTCAAGHYSFPVSKGSDGTYDFTVDETNGVSTTTPVSQRWVLDTVAPAAPVISVPATNPLTSANNSEVISGSCESGATVTLGGTVTAGEVGGGSLTKACASNAFSFTINKAVDGTYDFTVTQTDLAGNVSASDSQQWVRDSTIPMSPTVTTPASTPVYNSASSLTIAGGCVTGFDVTLSGSISAAEVTGGSLTKVCAASAYSFVVNKSLDGSYSIGVDQTNGSGITSSPTQITWVRDTSAPSTPTVVDPSISPYVSSGDLTISGACETGAAVALSGSDTQSVTCAAGAYSFLISKSVDATYTFSIQQTDAAGNVSGNATQVWQRDSSTPPTPVISIPASLPYQSTGSTLTITGSCITGYQVTLMGDVSDPEITSPAGSSVQTCAGNSFTFVLGKTVDGPYNFQVVQTSLSGFDSNPATVQWTRDTTAPVTTIASSPSNPNLYSTATFTFTADDPSATFECSLDGAAFASCSSPKSYSGLTNASHTVQVRARDVLGNLESSPQSVTWTQAAYNTIALYHMDTATVATTDSSSFPGGYKNPLTNSGSTSVTGKFSQGQAFASASSQYMTAADSATLSLTSQTMTVEMFVKPTVPANGTYVVLASKTGGAGNLGWEFGLYTNASGLKYMFFRASLDGATTTEVLSSSMTYSTTAFRHYAVTWNKGTVKFFYNGSQKGTGTIGTAGSAAIFQGNGSLMLGRNTGGSYFNGSMDEVRISQTLRYTATTYTAPAAAFTAD